jgi:ATP-dependent Clp protease ATP-binding subunit ClpC
MNMWPSLVMDVGDWPGAVMLERFTDLARRAIVLAQEEARRLNHSYIGPEHILLGLISEGGGVAARALELLGIDQDGLRRQVEDLARRGEESPAGAIPLTPRAKTVLELTLREAQEMGHNYIGTEHILLGLIREGNGVVPLVLAKLGADLHSTKQQVSFVLQGSRAGGSAPTGEPPDSQSPHLGL